MENHPIPQDVTGFQFRLIGSLTVKQFAYVAASSVLAVAIWYLPIPAYVKAPLLIIVGGAGPALAFLPIEGRPMDQMAGHFLKALASPNQYIYRKTGGKLPLSTIELHKVKQLTAQETAQKQAEKQKVQLKEEKLEMYLHQIHKNDSPIDQRENAFMQAVLSGKPVVLPPLPTQQVSGHQSIASPVPPQPQPQQPTAPIQQPPTQQQPAAAEAPSQGPVVLPSPKGGTPEERQRKLEQVEEAIKKEDELSKQLDVAKQSEAKAHNPTEQQIAHKQTEDLHQKLQAVLEKKTLLEQELQRLQQDISAAGQAFIAYTPPQAPAPDASPKDEKEEKQKEATPGARSVPKDQVSQVGIPTLPGVPNLIFGIVKDPRGNVLPGILVEVKDAEDNPVRAFKTNALGQFAAATALPNGTYTILFEDQKGQHKFDIVELVIKGEVIQPIEVISHDAREALRQSLFG